MASLEQDTKVGDTPPLDDGAAADDDAQAAVGGVDRDRLLNDILNTGVMGALIGGFALSNVQMVYDFTKSLDIGIYMCSFVGVQSVHQSNPALPCPAGLITRTNPWPKPAHRLRSTGPF